MAVKFFGQFLVEQGAVTPQDVVRAMNLQEEVNLRFGEMAEKMGLISKKDIERIHLAQRTEDLRFGDMALKLGILTEEQHEQVLERQRETHLYIGEALVRIGALAPEKLDEYLEAFRVDQAPYRVDHVKIPEGVEPAGLWEVFADLTCKMFTRIVQIPVRPGRCEKAAGVPSNDVVVALPVLGDAVGTYYLSVSRGVRDRIARSLLKQEDLTGESEELLVDTVMEFANIICGNVSAKAAQIGYGIEIEPPEPVEAPGGLTVPDGYVGLVFPLHAADEKIQAAIICPAEHRVSETGYDYFEERSGVRP